MKVVISVSLIIFSFSTFFCQSADNSKIFIRLNQVGFQPGDFKTAVLISEHPISTNKFSVNKVSGNLRVFNGDINKNFFAFGNFEHCVEIDFSEVNEEGEYFITVDESRSYPFKISKGVFNRVRDSLSLFFKVQRCGPTNPILHQPCHLSDVANVIGYSDSSAADVTGGWHDAGDYIKFFSTAAYTTYLLLFSYEFDQSKFGYDLNENDVPDILEEARVGIDWLLRCRFTYDFFITQVQDVSDHSVGWRLPESDTLRYDRPGFTGIGKNQIGMFTAVMSLASRIWREKFYDVEFSDKLIKSAIEVYNLKDLVPDIDTMQSGFYQDLDHWGKLSLGAIELFITTNEQNYFNDALSFADSAKSDFWWSWGNINSLAHFKIAKYEPAYELYIKNNLDNSRVISDQSSFRESSEYTWGTTNSFLGTALQSILYKELTDKTDYDSLMIFQRDYILGRNPWGISFIYNIGTKFSSRLHSQVGFFNNGYLPGALSSGPAPISILEKYEISRTDLSTEYFNTDSIKYFDDYNDYLTNEPTIGSNATALFVFGYFSASKQSD